MAGYIALVHKDAGTSYGVSFPDVPGCISAGDTFEQAVSNAAEALAGHFSAMRADGEALPQPRNFSRRCTPCIANFTHFFFLENSVLLEKLTDDLRVELFDLSLRFDRPFHNNVSTVVSISGSRFDKHCVHDNSVCEIKCGKSPIFPDDKNQFLVGVRAVQ